MNRLNQVRERAIAVLLPWAMGLGVVLVAAGWNSSLAVPSPAAESQPQYQWIAEQDVEIPMRDGARLKADIFRPDSAEKFPIIMNMGPYQKDKLWVPPPDLEEKPNRYMNWETANPEWWCPRGYILIRVDSRALPQSIVGGLPQSHSRKSTYARFRANLT